jgi:hypothetical protein
MRFIDLTGRQFGELVVLRRVDNSTGDKTRFEVRCSCTRKAIVHAQDLKSGHTMRCYQCRNVAIGKKKTTHGMSKHPARAVWNTMWQRCRNPRSTKYKDYGGRGIYVCPEWQTFEVFWADMGETYQPGLSIDRIDNDGPYSADNCRWVTNLEQQQNTRRTCHASEVRKEL